MPDKAQPGRTIGSCLGSIVLREHPADGVFVDIDAKGTRNLLCDAGTANTGIAALELDDRVDEPGADDLPTRKATDICVS
jgi:hypothetical protein